MLLLCCRGSLVCWTECAVTGRATHLPQCASNGIAAWWRAAALGTVTPTPPPQPPFPSKHCSICRPLSPSTVTCFGLQVALLAVHLSLSCSSCPRTAVVSAAQSAHSTYSLSILSVRAAAAHEDAFSIHFLHLHASADWLLVCMHFLHRAQCQPTTSRPTNQPTNVVHTVQCVHTHTAHHHHPIGYSSHGNTRHTNYRQKSFF